MSTSLRDVFVTVATTVLVVGVLPAAAASAAATPDTAGAAAATITVTSPAKGGFSLSTAMHRAGSVPMHFVSQVPLDSKGNGGSDVAVLHLQAGATKAQLIRYIQAQGNPKLAAASTRWLKAHVDFYGGAAIRGIGLADSVLTLQDGGYLVADVNAIFAASAPGAPAPQLTALQISGPAGTPVPPRVGGTITMMSPERFAVSSTSFAQGSRLLVRNGSDMPHFASFQPVKPGTTDALMTKVANAELHGTKPPSNPYLAKEGVEADVLSPGQQEVFSSPVLTAGTYDLECYIADDSSGLPHFFMGMHKVIVVT